MSLVILKVGGSVCTEKEKNRAGAKVNVITRVAREIKKARKRRKFKLILVHGAGPFGHKLVSDYKIKNGVKCGNKRQVEGFVKTHNSMEDLNKTFTDIFRKEGLLGFPVQPSACIVQNNKEIARFDISIIKRLLEFEDVIPIMYGDMVIDEKLGASVVSGDAIVSYIAKKLNANLILLGSDVDGIFTADPKKSKNAEIIKKIGGGNFKKVLGFAEEASTVDVTRGMLGKLLEVRKIANGSKVIVFNLNKGNNLCNLLLGKSGIGTEIKF